MTTRRLADRIEYSQPVLCSHFEGKDAIVSAVASRGLGSWPRYCTTRAEGPFAGCKAASGRQQLHQGVKIRLPLTRLTDGAKDLRRHSQPPVHSINAGVEGTRGGELGHDPLGTKSRSCLTPFPVETGAPGTIHLSRNWHV